MTPQDWQKVEILRLQAINNVTVKPELTSAHDILFLVRCLISLSIEIIGLEVELEKRKLEESPLEQGETPGATAKETPE